MQIHQLHVYHIRVPMRTASGQTKRQFAVSNALMLRLQSSNGHVGYGEGNLDGKPHSNNVDDVIRTIKNLQAPLREQHFDSLEAIRDFMFHQYKQGVHPTALCMLELALLDAYAKTQHHNLSTLLVPTPKTFFATPPDMTAKNQVLQVERGCPDILPNTLTSHPRYCLNISSYGGLFNSLRLYNWAQANHCTCQLVIPVSDMGILRAASILFTKLVPEVSLIPTEHNYGTLQEDICTPSPSRDGWQLEIDEFRLNRYSIRTESWRIP